MKKTVTLFWVFLLGTVQYIAAQAPVVNSFNPVVARQNSSIQIKGTGFTGATEVRFGGTAAQSFSIYSDTLLFAMVGAGSSGNVSVTSLSGTGALPGFTFLPPPVITSFSPDSAFSGTTIQIRGTYFTGATAVSFGEVPAASFTVNSDTSLTAVVGNGASGTVAVTNLNGTGYLDGFMYRGPDIYNFTPGSGGPGTVVTISGIRLTGATTVAFGGVPAASFTVVSDNTITAVTGNGATGNVTVTTNSGTGTESGFIAPPYIAGISATAAPAGASVTLTGNSFAPATNLNSVYFGSVKALVTAASSTSLTVTVPTGGFFAPVSATANNLTGYASRAFATTFAGGPLVPASFALRQLVAPGMGSIIAIGDINNDRKPDILMPKPAGFAVLKNTSTTAGTTFDAAVNFPTSTTGGTGTAIAVADVNMDGALDVITAGSATNSITVFQNLSVGSNTQVRFFNGNNFTVGTGSYNLATGDLDRDGRPEIIVSNYNSLTISILRNTSAFSNISFAAKVDFTTLSNPGTVSLADLDGDGKLDIVLVYSGTAFFSVFRNTTPNGSNTLSFAPRSDIAITNAQQNIAMGDIDGDDRTDLILNSSTSFSVLKNTSAPGAISFAPKVDFAIPGGSSGVSINDLDGDGKPDIAANNFANGFTYVCKNTSTSTAIGFGSPVAYPVIQYSGYSYTVDMDSDGKTDILTSSSSGVYFLRNKFNEPPVITSFSPQSVRVGDTVMIAGNNFTGATAVSFGSTAFNSFTVLSDKSIAAIVGIGSGGTISVTTPYGTSAAGSVSILNPPVITSFTPASAAVGGVVAINGSGFSPVPAENAVFFGTTKASVTAATASSLTVTVPAGGSHQHLTVTVNGLTAWSPRFFHITFPGAGSGFAGYYFDTSNTISFPGATAIRVMNAGDLDSDGKPDLAFGFNIGTTTKIAVAKNTGSGTNLSFSNRQDQPQGGSNSISITDINGDTKPDVVTTTRNDLIPLAVYKNNSTPGNLAVSTDYLLNVPNNNSRLQTADIDQDGRPDIVFKSDYEPNVFVCRNTSTNGVTSYSTPVLAGTVTPGAYTDYMGELMVEDFSGDGRPDVAILFNSKLTILKNTGTAGSISFAAEVNYYQVNSSKTAVATDLDGDGRMDIAALYTQPNTLAIFRNTGTNGNISFANPVSTALGFVPSQVAAGDVDGDGKPDLFVTNNGASNLFSLFKNTSLADSITFAPAFNLNDNNAGPLLVSDIDGDGKPDILLGSPLNNRIRVYRNAIGEPIPIILCPPMSNVAVSSNISGATYQWQVDTGSGFMNIADNTNYIGTSTSTLQLRNIPSSWYGYKYRCLAGAVSSNVFTVQVGNRWAGTVSNAWENPANWSCGTLPDANTDVVVNSGTVIINSSVTIRSLKVKPGATVTVAGTNILSVLH